MIPPLPQQVPSQSPQSPPSPTNNGSGWVGRMWKQFTHLPQKFLELTKRVFSIWDKSPKSIVNNTDQPLSLPISNRLQSKQSDQTFTPKASPHSVKRSNIDLKTGIHAPANKKQKIEIHSQATHQPIISNKRDWITSTTHPGSNKPINSDNILFPPHKSEINPPPIHSNTLSNQIPEEDSHTINVPDKGDCLFCAIGVGIKLLYTENESIQNKLNWAIPPNSLKRNLKNEETLLAEPSRHLRQQAADFLEEHQDSLPIVLSLMTNIIDHNEIIEKKIQDEQAITVILEDDIETLKERLKHFQPSPQNDVYDSIASQITAKRSQLHHVQESIEQQRKSIIVADDLESYIKHSRKEGFYCGTAQIMALSHIYRIPIEVIFDYSKETERRELFNPTKSTTPKLTLALINNNHFKFYHD